MKTYTKISETQFELTETKEVETKTTVTLDELESEKLRLLTGLNGEVSRIKDRVAEIDEQITSLKSEGAKTSLEVENEKQALEKTEKETKIAEELEKSEKEKVVV